MNDLDKKILNGSLKLMGPVPDIRSCMKPCPFCGSENIKVDFSARYGVSTPDPEAYRLEVKCNKCKAEVTFAPGMIEFWAGNMLAEYKPEFDPFEHWNARAGEKEDDDGGDKA